jgi:hypothetical protein
MPFTCHPPITTDLASRRYTSFVDLGISSQLSHLPQWSHEHVETIFARDLRPSDANASNLILIGSRQANPWVSLIEPSMNFVLKPVAMQSSISSTEIRSQGNSNNIHLRKDRETWAHPMSTER